MQPQREQSGSPPNWHGSTLVLKSAEMVRVVRAKMHSLRRLRRMQKGLQHTFRHIQLGIDVRGPPKASRSRRVARSSVRHSTGSAPRCGVKMLIQIFSAADWPTRNRGTRRRYPGRRAITARDRAVNRDVMPLDVPQDLLVSGRFAAQIVVRLQAIDGDRDPQTGQRRPGLRNRTESAGHHLHVNPSVGEYGEQDLQFAVAHQRIAADDGEMEGSCSSTNASTRRTSSSPL